jgi:hypothetical protein
MPRQPRLGAKPRKRLFALGERPQPEVPGRDVDIVVLSSGDEIRIHDRPSLAVWSRWFGKALVGECCWTFTAS